MKLAYLNGHSWADVTREERFFCAHLFLLIRSTGVKKFVAYLNQHSKLSARLDEDAEWEVAYEVCFYRDFHRHRGSKNTASAKRTFDLALFSAHEIVIIEAKAQQGFNCDQLRAMKRDKAAVSKRTKARVQLWGLASSKYRPRSSTLDYFDGDCLRWDDLAKHYDGDHTLQRADEIYRE